MLHTIRASPTMCGPIRNCSKCAYDCTNTHGHTYKISLKLSSTPWAKFGCGMCEDVCVVSCSVACCTLGSSLHSILCLEHETCAISRQGKITLTMDESFGILESRLADGAQYNVIWSHEQQSCSPYPVRFPLLNFLKGPTVYEPENVPT